MRIVKMMTALSLWIVVTVAHAIVPSPPQLAANSWILMDATTGRILSEQNADNRVDPASLTKIMTSYIVSVELDKGRISNDDVVPVSRNSWAQNRTFKDSSLMWIEPGKKVTLEQLHKGMVIASGNDASTAIAEHIAGSEESFSDLMNAHAKLLGMENSQFSNAHGLSSKNHFTTARDMALLSKATLQYPETYAYYSDTSFTYNGIRQPNRNGLINNRDGVDGLKTGYTRKAGYCLATSAKKDDMRLISVVMGAKSTKSREQETKRLLSYGFRFFSTSKIADEGTLTEIKVLKGKEGTVGVTTNGITHHTHIRSSNDKITTEIDLNPYVVAPFDTNELVGHLIVFNNGEEITKIPLYTENGMKSGGMLKRLIDTIIEFFINLTQ